MVETAGDGFEALEKFRRQPFDLIITDKAMPRMSGEQLAAEVKALSPRTRVILLTGYGAISDLPPEASCVDLILDKPTTCNALREAIGKVMSAVAEPGEPVEVSGFAPVARAADLEHASM